MHLKDRRRSFSFALVPSCPCSCCRGQTHVIETCGVANAYACVCAQVRVVGDKAVMLASEYSRLSVAASMIESSTTPASTKESGISLAQRASTAGEHPRALRVDSGPGGMEIVTTMTVSPATHTSGANRSSDDMLNLSSDHSSPFSNLSKESPAFTSFAYRDFDLGLSGGELDDTGHKEMDGAKTRTGM